MFVPAIQDKQPEEVQRRVRCHSPTKAAGDPFADAYKELVAAWPPESPDDKRVLFVVSALILVPRSTGLVAGPVSNRLL